jgi:hypothetical protein
MLSQLAAAPGGLPMGVGRCAGARRGEPNTSGHAPSRPAAGDKAAPDNGGSLPAVAPSALRNGAGAPRSDEEGNERGPVRQRARRTHRFA